MRVLTSSLLLVLLLSMAGCSGGGGGSSSSASSTTGPSTTTDNVVTVISTTTIGGSVTTVTNTITQTTTESGAPAGPVATVDNVTVVPGANKATVSWDVAGGTAPLHSHAEYGFASQAGFGNATGDNTGAATFSAVMTGLKSCSDYKVRIAVSDAAGVTLHTGGHAFSTTAGSTPLAATTVSVPAVDVLDTGFKVHYTVNGPSDVHSHIEYGLTLSLNQLTDDVAGNGTKVVALTGLTAGTAYNYRIVMTGPCGSAVYPTTGVLTQSTATVKHVDINGNFAALHSFAPGSTADGGALALTANTPYVFDITNKDAGSMAHTFYIADNNGNPLTPAYGSPQITAGNTYHFTASVALPTGSYQMRCALHSTMMGSITVS